MAVYDNFFDRKSVKGTTQNDRFRWLKSVHEILNFHRQEFWKYVWKSEYRSNTPSNILINEPHDVAEAFSKHLQLVYSSSRPGIFSFINKSTEVPSLVPVSNSDVHNIIKRLRPIKLLGLDNMPSSVAKSCCEIFMHVLKFIFNISISQNTFLMRKQTAIVPFSKKETFPPLEITSP
jgi:hypothetical protein